MKIILLLINIGIFFGWQITAQTNEYIYQDRFDRVEKLNASGKFIGLSLYNTNTHEKKGILYDTLGNKLFEYKVDTARMKDFLPNERNNQVIVINEHLVNQRAYMDEIVSHDIYSKSVKWKTKVLGQDYKISPNGKYLLTVHYNEDPDLKQKTKPEIIELENGDFLPLDNNYDGFIADWYDSTRIIIYTWDFEQKKNEQFISNYETYTKGLDSISRVKAKLYSNFEKGTISKDEYETTLLQLNNDQKDIIISQRKQLAKQGKPYTSSVSEYRLIRYNILTNQIEMEKNIKEGEDIPTLAKQIFIGKYLGENNVFVYIKETRNKLYKLDSNFNLIWTAELEFPFYEIIENDKIYFVIYEEKGDVYKLITKNGQKQILSKTNGIVVDIQKNKLEYSNIIDLRGNFSFDRPNNRIKLSKE